MQDIPPPSGSGASLISRRLRFTVFALLDVLRLLPLRLMRLAKHFPAIYSYTLSSRCHGLSLPLAGRLLLWLGELILLLLDVLGLPDIYQILSVWIKISSRPLKAEERSLARRFFGDALAYDRIWVDEASRIGPRQYHFCYVSFCVINSWGDMPMPVLIHELVHVIQYQQHGSPYLLRALVAQYSQEGYHYGGVSTLRKLRRIGEDLSVFNYEQQASIVEDYARLMWGLPTRWATATEKDLEIYAHFAAGLH